MTTEEFAQQLADDFHADVLKDDDKRQSEQSS